MLHVGVHIFCACVLQSLTCYCWWHSITAYTYNLLQLSVWSRYVNQNTNSTKYRDINVFSVLTDNNHKQALKIYDVFCTRSHTRFKYKNCFVQGITNKRLKYTNFLYKKSQTFKIYQLFCTRNHKQTFKIYSVFKKGVTNNLHGAQPSLRRWRFLS